MNDTAPHPQSWCERLFHARAAGLILYGRALGLSHGEAEDVVQETFLALLKLTEPPTQPERYCLRAFRHRAINFRRSLWRRVAREFEARDWFEPGVAESPAEAVAMRCLRTLPAEQREVIVLKIWHAHTFQEIGELLDVSPHTAAGRYRYGLQRLRACLRENQENEHEHTARTGDALEFLDAPGSVPHA